MQHVYQVLKAPTHQGISAHIVVTCQTYLSAKKFFFYLFLEWGLNVNRRRRMKVGFSTSVQQFILYIYIAFRLQGEEKYRGIKSFGFANTYWITMAWHNGSNSMSDVRYFEAFFSLLDHCVTIEKKVAKSVEGSLMSSLGRECLKGY